MHAGKIFRLQVETLGAESGNRRRLVMLPVGATVEVVSGPRRDDPRAVDVQWDGITVTVFAEDIETRGEEIDAQSA